MRKLGGVGIFGLFFAAVLIMVLLPRDFGDMLHRTTSATAPAKIMPADFKVVAPAAAMPDVTTLGVSTTPVVTPTAVAMTPVSPAVVAPAAITAAPPPATDYRLTTASLNMRTEPSVDAPLVASLPKGTRIAVSQTNGHWLMVTTDAGQSGWLSGNFVSASTISASVAAATAPNGQLVSSVAK